MEPQVKSFNCPQCGAPLNSGVKECRYCGEVINTIHNVAAQSQPQPQPTPVVQTVYVQQAPPQPVLQPKKSKTTAGILAILLGGLGVHKFYLGNWKGIFYILFCWTYIPSIIGIIEGIKYLSMSDAEFAQKYGGYY